VDPHEAAAGADVTLERGLLRLVQYVAGGQGEDDHVIAVKVLVSENGRVLGRIDREAVPGGELPDGRHGIRDRGMAEAGGLRKDQRAEPGLRLAEARSPQGATGRPCCSQQEQSEKPGSHHQFLIARKHHWRNRHRCFASEQSGRRDSGAVDQRGAGLQAAERR
jgi:hypothetical protein